MATLVLGSVGSLVGGPIGGAIGSIIGNALDRSVLAPKGRRGARLGQQAVQTSSYGTAIPRLFGRLRVAGTVIWASDLRESEGRSGGGKGRPATTSYSYSASFAVALSGRAIRGVGRIWADGKLLRGAAGDWKSTTGFRLHHGGEAQAADPLIASAEGIDTAPAYRGIAYAVFEDMQLADYGNRIPSLTFEVEADEGPVAITTIAATLSDGAVTGAGGAMLDGYAAGGDSVRGALEALAEAVPMTVAVRGGRLAIGDGGAAVAIAADAVPSIERRAAGTVPDEVSIGYHDPARDWQAGLQRARRGGVARRVEAIELAAALDAGAAKALAEGRLARDWAGRTMARVTLPWAALGLAAGAAVTLPGRGERWRIAATTIEGMAVTLELVATHRGGGAMPPASAGRAAGEADAPPGATRLAVLDLPGPGDASAATLRLWIAAAGTAPGWRRAMLEADLAGGDRAAIGRTASPAVIGETLAVLPAAGAALRDEASIIDVALLHDGMTLAGRADIAAVAGANLALVGDELVQFARAARVGPARWRLSGLLRGRRGTEPVADAPAGARFVLIEARALAAYDPPVTAIGATIAIEGLGAGDAVPVRAAIRPAGRALRPPSPVHVRATVLADGGIAIRWTRRSRAGFDWIDGADAPLAEESERYRVTIGSGGRTIETAIPVCDYSAADRVADGNAGRPVTIAVEQIGGFGLPSRAATIVAG